MMIRTYRELQRLRTFKERYEYLRLNGNVGDVTFGDERYINQLLYNSDRWRAIRNKVIIRDNGCDLGVDGYEINDKILIHHMNPIIAEDILHNRRIVYDLEFLICTSMNTHNAIHYGDDSKLFVGVTERKKNDTCPWL